MGGKLGSMPEVYNKLSMVDKAYVIIDHDRWKGGAKLARKFFEDCLVPCEIIVVDGKRDFRGIVDAVRRIVEENNGVKKVRYSMDITGGTALMSSALCYSAFFIGAETYYVMYDKEKEANGMQQDPLDERLVKLPTANVPDIKKLGRTTRMVLDSIYSYYYQDGGRNQPAEALTHSRLEEITGMSSSKIGYHLGVLRTKNIVSTREKEENRNITEILVTDDGRMIKGWVGILRCFGRSSLDDEDVSPVVIQIFIPDAGSLCFVDLLSFERFEHIAYKHSCIFNNF